MNIGAGNTKLEGFTPIDRKFGQEAYPLDYADNSVDEIRASHILEHFTFAEARDALTEWVRVLKPGGRIRLAVPDFDKIDKSDPNWAFYLMGGQMDANDVHKSIFDRDRLTAYMAECGLTDIRPWHSDNTDTASHKVSLNLEGCKAEPGAKPNDLIRLAAVMSIPRVGWNDCWGQVFEALSPFKIPIRRFTGVYWGQCMQRALTDCLADGLDWVLCIDYDTMFTAQHVDRLMSELAANPEIDALASTQPRRNKPYPLMTMGNATECEVQPYPWKVTTAHFGLTLIRMDALKDVPKPWFKTEPDEHGDYGDQRLDDDIWFWHQWRLAGKSIYVTPNVRVGHLELMVSEFGEDMNHRHIYVEDWRQREGIGYKKKEQAIGGGNDVGAMEIKNGNKDSAGSPAA